MQFVYERVSVMGICRYQFEISEVVNLGSIFGAKDFLHFRACTLLPVGVLS